MTESAKQVALQQHQQMLAQHQTIQAKTKRVSNRPASGTVQPQASPQQVALQQHQQTQAQHRAIQAKSASSQQPQQAIASNHTVQAVTNRVSDRPVSGTMQPQASPQQVALQQHQQTQAQHQAIQAKMLQAGSAQPLVGSPSASSQQPQLSITPNHMVQSTRKAINKGNSARIVQAKTTSQHFALQQHQQILTQHQAIQAKMKRVGHAAPSAAQQKVSPQVIALLQRQQTIAQYKAAGVSQSPIVDNGLASGVTQPKLTPHQLALQMHQQTTTLHQTTRHGDTIQPKAHVIQQVASIILDPPTSLFSLHPNVVQFRFDGSQNTRRQAVNGLPDANRVLQPASKQTDSDKRKGDDYANNVQKMVSSIEEMLSGYVDQTIQSHLDIINDNRALCAVDSSLANKYGKDTNTQQYGNLNMTILGIVASLKWLIGETDRNHAKNKIKKFYEDFKLAIGKLPEEAVDKRVGKVIMNNQQGNQTAKVKIDNALKALSGALIARLPTYFIFEGGKLATSPTTHTSSADSPHNSSTTSSSSSSSSHPPSLDTATTSPPINPSSHPSSLDSSSTSSSSSSSSHPPSLDTATTSPPINPSSHPPLLDSSSTSSSSSSSTPASGSWTPPWLAIATVGLPIVTWGIYNLTQMFPQPGAKREYETKDQVR